MHRGPWCTNVGEGNIKYWEDNGEVEKEYQFMYLIFLTDAPASANSGSALNHTASDHDHISMQRGPRAPDPKPLLTENQLGTSTTRGFKLDVL